MLEFKRISVCDFERYNKYRAQDETNASEGVFMTMFIWNEYYNLSLADNGEFLFIRFDIKGKEPSYFFPIGKGNLKGALEELSSYASMRGERLIFRLVNDENKRKLQELYGERFSYKESRDSYDYIYLTEKMISLSGKKLLL